ncbi:MAG: Bax inhibitor-1/YccA family protein [Archangium sp.]|nr:Bax inhibitor-1/YccA family protein [Archangium sp.]
MNEPGYSYSPTGSASSVLASESARVFMQRVYWWMSLGLALTGGIAFAVASSQELTALVMPHYYKLVVVELVVVFAFVFMQSKVSGPVAAGMFLLFAALNGLTLSAIFLVYELGSIGSAFVITAGMFGAMSVYGTVTKKDLSGWGSFLMMGLIGIIIAGVVNIFLQSDFLDFVKSCAGVVIFAGLTAYDTQKLRTHHANSGFSSAMSLSITGALMLYLDFINLFLHILRLLGRRR